MKYIFTLIVTLLIAQSVTLGQKRTKEEKKLAKQAEKFYNQVFSEGESIFDYVDVPAQWSDKSVVMLAKKVHMSFDKKGWGWGIISNGTTAEAFMVVRKMLALNDAAAIEQFSEFYYQKSDAIGVTVIKPNGEEYSVGLEDAVAVDTDVPSVYRDKYHSEGYFKIAIPNLEVGDIIDYYKVYKESYASTVSVTTPMATDIPIVQQELVLDVHKDWTVYHESFRGAPSFIEDKSGGLNGKGKKTKKVRRIVLKSEMLEAIEDVRWQNILEGPVVKFMAVPPKQQPKSKMVINKGMDPKVLFYSVLKAELGTYSLHVLEQCNEMYRHSDRKNKSLSETVDMIYTGCRTNFLKSPNQGFEQHGYALSRRYSRMNDGIFVDFIRGMFDRYDMKVEFAMAVPAKYGPIDEVVGIDEVVFGVYIPKIDEYFWPIDNYSRSDSYPNRMLGATGLRISEDDFFDKKKTYKKFTLPKSSADYNTYHTEMNAVLLPDNSMDVDVNIDLTGWYREAYSGLFLYNIYYIRDEVLSTFSEKAKKRILKQEKKEEKFRKMKKIRNDNLRERVEFDKKQIEVRKEMLDNWIKDEYKVKEVKEHSLLSNGVTDDEGILSMNFKFTSDGYVKKAGPNLIFDIGLLIQEQLKLEEDEMKFRDQEVLLNNAKLITNTISVTIPNGYTVNGIEELNFDFESDVASFSSVVKQDGNTIMVDTRKVYKKERFGAENWGNMVEFLELAYKFCQGKLVLKKQ